MKLEEYIRFNEPSKHKYIKLIEYSLKNEKFSADQACEATGLSEKEFRFIIQSLFSLNGEQAQLIINTEKNQEWILKPEAYFSYLQYLEYCNAIKQAKQAQWLAIAALIIPTVLSFFTK